MCGISGFYSRQRITKDTLTLMNDTMIHRGPDDSGVEIYEAPGGYTVGLAQRRLSILDLSPLGHQPMHSADGCISVVYNGEIYNYRELKEELSDYSFCSNCDTEVILAAYLKWGISCVEKFNGMFAICIYDRRSADLYLIRDRIGKKPLYYELEGENLVFASELKPIMARPGFSGKIRSELLPRYLFQQYINAPDSIFEHVYKLEPGSILKFKEGKSTIWKYWDVKTVYHKMQESPVTDYKQGKEELKALLNKAVASRMIADVPLGTFLSGGYDSSLTTAIAQKHSSEPVKTFSIGFNDERYNEAKYAREIAEYLGTDHTELYIGEKEMLDLVESIPEFYDEPFADSSQIPTMLVSKLAKSRVTVALSGDGGDEFFCGYNLYENVRKAQKLDTLGEMIHGICNLPVLRQSKVEERLPFKVRVIAGNRVKEAKTQFTSNNYMNLAEKMTLGEGKTCYYASESNYQVENWQIRRMLLDMDTYLPGDILCKVDRASMKYSLEARCPILDKDVMEYSFRLSHDLKYRNGIKKYILKEIAFDYIPKQMLERPKKGFSVPLDDWLHGPLKEQLLAVSDSAYLRRQGLFQPDFVKKLIENYLQTGDGGPSTGANYSRLIWSFFVFQQWYHGYCSNLS